jgi:carnosine N-methyltransferase
MFRGIFGNKINFMIFNTDFTTIGGVKIYINDVDSYIAESYLLLYNHNKLNERKLFQLTKYSGDRKEYIDKLIEAYLYNYNNIDDILSILKDKVMVDNILKLNLNTNNNYQITLKDFWYLQRDWCYFTEGEEQINIIVNSIKKELISYNLDNSLFLGCGVGRLAVEFCDNFNKIYSTDKSFSMIWHINRLLNSNNYEFYDLQPRNIFKIENVAQKYISFINDTKKRQIREKVEFFVSDALSLPFKNNSLDSIFSIYFSDVIALKLWFPNIDSILKANGLFIHFGPLDYFFTDETEMLTAEEFRLFFEKKGYITLVDKIIETTHLKESNSLSYQIYKNWFFIAKKGSVCLVD